MASIKNLKKDIDYIVSEIISDCYIYLYFNNNANEDKVINIISKSVELRNDLFHRTNNPEKNTEKKVSKQHYKNIYKDLLENSDNLFGQLSSLSK
ncbi:MAG: hypothetical protein A2046_15150 [Bacteroidetes bacterium GWA2_30_7]|nr:MAG: hypothetical protein A2046_15150 [Bacteroidetes bacterium GWA2_30_7]